MKTSRINLLTCVFSLLIAACGNGNSDYDASGIFEATEVIVSSQASGQLMAFNVEEGQELTANEFIGYVDTIQLYLSKMQLAANLKSVESKYLNVNQQIASLNEQIEKQRTEQKRYENLVQANAANQKQLDDINSQLLVLEKELAAQKETLQNNNTGVTGESSSLEVQIAQINDQIEKSMISSPVNGTVLAKYAEPGEITSQGRALFKVADMKHMYLRAYITADQITQMKLGQTIDVYADFGQKDLREYKGKVTWISDKSEFTPKTIQTRNERDNSVYAVKIAVENDGYLKQGMYAQIKINP